jgi:hypothetical protein
MLHKGSCHCGQTAYEVAAPNGLETASINVRCLDGVDLDELNRVPFDGRSL